MIQSWWKAISCCQTLGKIQCTDFRKGRGKHICFSLCSILTVVLLRIMLLRFRWHFLIWQFHAEVSIGKRANGFCCSCCVSIPAPSQDCGIAGAACAGLCELSQKGLCGGRSGLGELGWSNPDRTTVSEIYFFSHKIFSIYLPLTEIPGSTFVVFRPSRCFLSACAIFFHLENRMRL